MNMIYKIEKPEHQRTQTYNMNRTKVMISLVMLLCSVSLMAQNTMRVHYKDGKEQDIPISQIDSVTFVTQAAQEEEASLTGSWLWGNQEAGYYELLTFNEDHTYTGYDNYFSYGFDTMTYGWYTLYGNLLTLQSNGFGYNRVYKWFVVGLTGNALEVMTKAGPYTYYRLQPEVLRVSLSEAYTGFANGDAIVFADGVIVKDEGNKLQGLAQGSTYILVKIAAEEKIKAYQVIVG